MFEVQDSVGTDLNTKRTAKIRRRNCTTKSRSGCVTCKIKHLKCDETKPECSNCHEKGIRCGGYARQLQWSSKHQFMFHIEAPARHKKRLNRFKSIGYQDDSNYSPVSNSGLREPYEGPASSTLSEDIARQPLLDKALPLVSNPTSDCFSYSLEVYLSKTPGPRDEEVCRNTISTVQFANICTRPGSSLSSLPSATTQTPENPFSEESPATEPFSSSAARDKVSRIPRTILNVPSLLISRWFEQVCPIWSAFDSEISLNRTLAKKLWGESEAVLASLQSMSAAYMANQAPHMKTTTFQYMTVAMNAISSEILILNTTGVMRTLPVGVLFALVCMGTLFGWINRHELVKRLLRNTKAILSEAKLHYQAFSLTDREMLRFFISSTQYWDTLVTFMGVEDLPDAAIEEGTNENSVLHVENMGYRDSSFTPHPWTGISTLTSQLFCETTKCCRLFRRMIKGDADNTASLVDTLGVMEQAERLECQLKQLEYPDLHEIGDTGDRLTPRQHLVEAAEAYRLSALLHLYQTFPSISTEVSPIGAFEMGSDDAIWGDRVVPLALYLTDLLKKIPPESGSRSLLPILYIAASTGLRFQRSLPNNQQTQAPGVSHEFFPPQDALFLPDGLAPTNSHEPFDAFTSVGEDTILIGDARHLIIQRLGLLENCLYPKPIKIAKDLVKAIWEAHDNDIFTQHDVHWIDIMDDLDLRSIFG